MKSMKQIIGMLVAIVLLAGSVYATDTNDFTVGSTAVPAGLATPVILKGSCDFASTAVTASSVNKVITIPAGYVVQAISTKMTVKESTLGAGTYTIGDIDNATEFVGATLMTNVTTVTSSNCNSNKAYTATGYIVVVPDTACATGTISVSACVIPFK